MHSVLILVNLRSRTNVKNSELWDTKKTYPSIEINDSSSSSVFKEIFY